jgi:2',3'-cyclic-nucleotide 2'-phosphodiesterase (5'-nucleotidase family)
MRRRFSIAPLAILLLLAGCRPFRNPLSKGGDEKLEVTFVQVNDVYEIAPLSGGEGGMARVATLKKQQLALNPNTFLVMAGDFVSPSIFNSLQYEGKAVRGKQMIEAMNTAGMDLAVLGNHEFDIKESELQERIDESRFQWVSTNAFHNAGGKIVPFSKRGDTAAFPKYKILQLADKDGTSARIAIIGLTLPANRASYVQYTDAFTEAKAAYALLKDSADAVVALTHQSVAEDIRLAKEVPGLALILGGHEHDQQYEKVGNVYITKAHSNARSAYVVKMQIDKGNGRVKVTPQLKYLDASTPLDATTDSVVQKWIGIADRNFGTSGFDARKVVMATGSPLDGRETEIRHRVTNLTELVVSAMEYAAPKADVVFFNSGSIRVDDILNTPVTQYDILRAMPFGGGIREADMKGSLLQKVLTAGRKNVGNGGFLQYSSALTFDEPRGQWLLKGTPIEAGRTYRVAMSDFLLTGKETNLDFLNAQNPEMVTVHEARNEKDNPLSDIRLAIVRYLEAKR